MDHHYQQSGPVFTKLFRRRIKISLKLNKHIGCTDGCSPKYHNYRV